MRLISLKAGRKNKNCFNYGIITVKPCFTDTRLLRTPHYDGQFALSLGKESRYIFS